MGEEVALAGSSNMDIRSFQLDLEVMLMVCARTSSTDCGPLRTSTASSRELTEWSKRSQLHGLVDNLTRLTAAVQ